MGSGSRGNSKGSFGMPLAGATIATAPSPGSAGGACQTDAIGITTPSATTVIATGGALTVAPPEAIVAMGI